MAKSTAHMPTGGVHQEALSSAGDERIINNMADGEAKEKKKAKKKKLRPKLKPLSSNEFPEMTKTPPGGDDFGFGNFLPSVSSGPSSSNSSSQQRSSRPPIDGMEKSPDMTAGAAAAEEPYPLTSPIAASAPKIKLKQRPAAKLRPCPTPTPRAPNADAPLTPDDDDYDAFGFGLVKSTSNEAEPKDPAAENSAFDDTTIGDTRGKPNVHRTPSPQSLRRVLSSESYISDDSSSSSESASLHLIKRDLMREDEIKKRNNRGRASLSSPRRIRDGERTTGIRNSASFSSTSSDSSFDPSARESPYLSSIAPPQTHHNNQQPSSNPHLYPKSHHPISSSSPPHTPPTLVRPNSTPLPPGNIDDVGSTDSENWEQDENERSKRRRSYDSSNNGSPTRQSGTPYSHGSSSVDDQVIANELSAYSLSRKLSQGSTDYLSGGSRPHAPLDGHPPSDAPTPVTPVRSFYASPHSAMLAATASQSTPRPLAVNSHDSSFLLTLREGWMGATGSIASVSLEGSLSGPAGSPLGGSPRGAFVGEPQLSPPRADLGFSVPVKLSSAHTTHCRAQSLVYSDEEDSGNARRMTAAAFGRRGLSNAEEGGMEGAKGDTMHNEGSVTSFQSRWIMLFYMSSLNLLGGWTCFSVSPISGLTGVALDIMDPESLVATFLTAAVLGMVCEPAVLGRIGLRRTVLLGSLLLMLGNVVKSGSAGASEMDLSDHSGWRTYLGFILAGLSQPFYQCTTTLMVASWFPKRERSFARNVVLDAHPFGIGCAFVAGALLVEKSEDVFVYFHLLSVVSTVLFVGAAMQLDDTPPFPPTEGTARVIRGTVERSIVLEQRVSYHNNKSTSQGTTTTKSSDLSYSIGGSRPTASSAPEIQSPKPRRAAPRLPQRKYWQGKATVAADGVGGSASSRTPLFPSPASFGSSVETTSQAAATDSTFEGPSELVMDHINADGDPVVEEFVPLAHAPRSLMIQGSYGSTDTSLAGYRYVTNSNNLKSTGSNDNEDASSASPFPNLGGSDGIRTPPPPRGGGAMPVLPVLDYHNFVQRQSSQHTKDQLLPPTEEDDDGAEPIMTQTPRRLDIEVRGDRLWRSLQACFSREGFSHCVLAFVAAGITGNTLTAFMDDLAALGEDDTPVRDQRYHVGVVGGTFQLLLIISSIACRRRTDEIRKYYVVIIALLALGGLALALCSTNLDLGGGQLWSNLLMVAAFTGPLQPLSTELGVEVAYPLSENTVFVNQQVFSNLLSAAAILAFKALRDASISSAAMPFTYSFYFLVGTHALTLMYFGTFDVMRCSHREEE